MKIIIIGAYGTALNIAECITDACINYGCKDEVLGFAIDNDELGDNIGEYPILCTPREIAKKYTDISDIRVIFSLYKPTKMRERAELLRSYGLPDSMFHTFIHPSAYIAKSSNIGVGNVVLSNCTIQSKVNIGSYNIINSNVVIEHDTTIGNNNFIAASVCIGSLVKVEDSTFIGLQSSIRENTVIGANSFVGAHSNVLKNVKKCDIVYGNPARIRC